MSYKHNIRQSRIPTHHTSITKLNSIVPKEKKFKPTYKDDGNNMN